MKPFNQSLTIYKSVEEVKEIIINNQTPDLINHLLIYNNQTVIKSGNDIYLPRVYGDLYKQHIVINDNCILIQLLPVGNKRDVPGTITIRLVSNNENCELSINYRDDAIRLLNSKRLMRGVLYGLEDYINMGVYEQPHYLESDHEIQNYMYSARRSATISVIGVFSILAILLAVTSSNLLNFGSLLMIILMVVFYQKAVVGADKKWELALSGSRASGNPFDA